LLKSEQQKNRLIYSDGLYIHLFNYDISFSARLSASMKMMMMQLSVFHCFFVAHKAMLFILIKPNRKIKIVV